jgi:hypothetical protein
MKYGSGDRVTPQLNQPIPEISEIGWLYSTNGLKGNFDWWFES